MQGYSPKYPFYKDIVFISGATVYIRENFWESFLRGASLTSLKVR